MNKIILFSGPSGVGKGTIEKMLFANENLRLKLSVSATTRMPRTGESHGREYFFLSQEDFQTKIKSNEFIEWDKHFNNYYGTLKSEIDNILSQQYNCFIEVETNGAKNIMEYYRKINKENLIVSIFILPPSFESLTQRIINRGTENIEQIQKRLDRAKEEIENAKLFKYQIINDDLNTTYNNVKNIIENEV